MNVHLVAESLQSARPPSETQAQPSKRRLSVCWSPIPDGDVELHLVGQPRPHLRNVASLSVLLVRNTGTGLVRGTTQPSAASLTPRKKRSTKHTTICFLAPLLPRGSGCMTATPSATRPAPDQTSTQVLHQHPRCRQDRDFEEVPREEHVAARRLARPHERFVMHCPFCKRIAARTSCACTMHRCQL